MRPFSLPMLTLAASTLLAAPSFADDLYDARPLALPTPQEADVTNPGLVYAQPNGAGLYDCQLNEKRTRLERRNCGPLKDISGE